MDINLQIRKDMKKYRNIFILCAVAVIVTLSACTSGDAEKNYDESLLYGTWECSDGYTYDFNSNHKGRSYKEDFTPIEFDWALDDDMLNIENHGRQESGSVYVQTLIITSLSINRMTCYDMIDPDEKLTFQRK